MDKYQCAGCGRDSLTDRTAVHVEGTDDYLCGKVTERPTRLGIDYDGIANVMCLNIYITQKSITERRPTLLRVEAIQEFKKANNPQRV